MPLDPEKLLNYPIPEVTQTYTKRDTVFYALSIGLGQDPLDERQLDFVDHHRKLKVFPSMPVVLAHPGFWLAWPDTGVDAVKVVHGEQGIRWLKPLPPEGVVRGKTQITGLIDKGRDKGALLYSEKHLFDERGETLAILSSTTFLRGDGGFGGPSGPVKPVHPIPERPPELVLDLPTRPEQALYYRLNGDENPLHADPEVARRAGFPRPILHGLCTLGVVTHALLRLLCDYDPEGLASLELRFSAPVYPGETIRTEIWPREGAFRARAVERDVVVINHGKVVLKA